MKCLLLAAACTLAAIVPIETVCRERCDVIETNDFRDENGRTVFVQQIFYEWSPCHERYMVRAWRLVKNGQPMPEYDHDRRCWSCTWLDGEIMRCVTATSYRQSFTQFDPELCEREILCKDKRRELSHPTAARPR